MYLSSRYVSVCFFVAALLSGLLLVPQSAKADAAGQSDMKQITEWQMLWEQPGEERNIEQVEALDDESWFTVQAGGEYPNVPSGVNSAWIKVKLPEMTQMQPALDITKLYAINVAMYREHQKIYERNRNYTYDRNEILLPISQEDSSKVIYMKLETNLGKLGLYADIPVGEYDELSKSFIKRDLLDIVLGATLIFISFFMMASVLFLNRAFQPGWNSLFLVMLSVGTMILTYSSFLDKYFPDHGVLFLILFDISSVFLLPSLFYFFEKIFGKGPLGLVEKFKKVQMIFVPVFIILMGLSYVFESVEYIYGNFGMIGFGLSVVLGNLILIFSLWWECRSRNKEAVILSVGISIFAGVGLVEILWYFYSDMMYKLFYWKISILFFLTSLIIILVRRIMNNYKQALDYSKQIEIFNNELQRTEKIELISNLAASIAHEVRNPLQVTRGFLQLLGEKSKGTKEQNYMSLAITELDRASEIITDFLTFAKPDLGEVMKLDAMEEVQQIAAILSPLATMQGGVLHFKGEKRLYVRGNSSRFKQALINIIKNSIEALGDNGEVAIRVSRERNNNRVIIMVSDNGEGIDEEDLKKLGEPYYSKKTKGTGLGLMVTFRIIEAMNGEIVINSTRGKGTEVCIKIPEVI
jgi:two-component system, sporulation sensor kinase B